MRLQRSTSQPGQIGLTAIPDGHGVSCADCNASIPMSETVDSHQKIDRRIDEIRHCRFNKGARFQWDVKHDELIHPCGSYIPPNPAQPVRFMPLPSFAARQQLEQKALNPRCDYLSSAAIADRMFRQVKTGKSKVYEARQEITKIEQRTPVVGKMVNGLFEDKLKIDALRRPAR